MKFKKNKKIGDLINFLNHFKTFCEIINQTKRKRITNYELKYNTLTALIHSVTFNSFLNV